jgi:hypothetical protein
MKVSALQIVLLFVLVAQTAASAPAAQLQLSLSYAGTLADDGVTLLGSDLDSATGLPAINPADAYHQYDVFMDLSGMAPDEDFQVLIFNMAYGPGVAPAGFGGWIPNMPTFSLANGASSCLFSENSDAGQQANDLKNIVVIANGPGSVAELQPGEGGKFKLGSALVQWDGSISEHNGLVGLETNYNVLDPWSTFRGSGYEAYDRSSLTIDPAVDWSGPPPAPPTAPPRVADPPTLPEIVGPIQPPDVPPTLPELPPIASDPPPPDPADPPALDPEPSIDVPVDLPDQPLVSPPTDGPTTEPPPVAPPPDEILDPIHELPVLPSEPGIITFPYDPPLFELVGGGEVLPWIGEVILVPWLGGSLIDVTTIDDDGALQLGSATTDVVPTMLAYTTTSHDPRGLSPFPESAEEKGTVPLSLRAFHSSATTPADTSVPEPATTLLVIAMVSALGLVRRRRND